MSELASWWSLWLLPAVLMLQEVNPLTPLAPLLVK